MIRLVLVACLFLLSSAYRSFRGYDYDPCAGDYVGNGDYNLAGKDAYGSSRQVELVCDFKKAGIYGVEVRFI